MSTGTHRSVEHPTAFLARQARQQRDMVRFFAATTALVLVWDVYASLDAGLAAADVLRFAVLLGLAVSAAAFAASHKAVADAARIVAETPWRPVPARVLDVASSLRRALVALPGGVVRVGHLSEAHAEVVARTGRVWTAGPLLRVDGSPELFTARSSAVADPGTGLPPVGTGPFAPAGLRATVEPAGEWTRVDFALDPWASALFRFAVQATGTATLPDGTTLRLRLQPVRAEVLLTVEETGELWLGGLPTAKTAVPVGFPDSPLVATARALP